LIFSDQKPRYLDALAAADGGNLGRLAEFVRDQSIDAMSQLTVVVERARVASADELRAEGQRLFFSSPRLNHDQVDSLAERLLHEVMSTCKTVFEDLRLPEEISLSAQMGLGDSEGAGEGYRRLARKPVLSCIVRSKPPARVGSQARFRPLVALDTEHPKPVRIEEHITEGRFEAGLDELFPEISTGLRFRLRTWVESLVSALVGKVFEASRRSLAKL
jgi:hypothetical protein